VFLPPFVPEFFGAFLTRLVRNKFLTAEIAEKYEECRDAVDGAYAERLLLWWVAVWEHCSPRIGWG
jgi:hypothetical protein